MEQTDQQLLQQYQRTGDDAPLQALIGRHLNQVYSSAVRQVRDRHLAEDVTQAVFILFSQKAPAMSPSVIVPGWLFRTTRYVALHAMKKQSRRLWHEQHAARPERIDPRTDPRIAPDGASTWQELSPSIDAALAQLKARYRDALILRFFQSMSLAQVGQAMGISEEAARKLVDRGLERLRGTLASSGVACTEAGLVTALSQQIIESAPAHLAQWAAHLGSGAAVGAGAGTNALALTKGGLTIMATTKVKVAAAIIIAAAVVGGGTVAVQALGPSRPAAPAPAQPAAQVAPNPPAAEVQAATPEVRAAALELCTAASNCDQAAVEAFSLVESPEYREVAEALSRMIGDAQDMRKVTTEKFGSMPEEVAQYLPGGPEVFRKQILPNAPVRFRGDDGTIDLGPGNTPSALVFRKEGGKWRFVIGQSFCGGDPGKANAMTIRIMRVGEVFRSATESAKAGEFASTKDMVDHLGAQMRAMEGN